MKFIMLTLALMFLTKCAISTASSPQMENSVWLWNATTINEKELAADLEKANLQRIYVNVGWEPSTKENYLEEHADQYSKFISRFQARGGTVEALLGDSKWTLRSQIKSLKSEIQTVLDYNRTHGYRFQSIHLDIEPHGVIGWEENKEDYMRQFLFNLKEVRRQIDAHNEQNKDSIQLHIDLANWVYQVNINEKPSLPQLFQVVDEVTVMDYTRNMDLYLNAAKIYLEQGIKSEVTVYIGSEFQKDYADVTLAGLSKKEWQAHQTKAKETFESYESFGGFAFHDWSSYHRYLKED